MKKELVCSKMTEKLNKSNRRINKQMKTNFEMMVSFNFPHIEKLLGNVIKIKMNDISVQQQQIDSNLSDDDSFEQLYETFIPTPIQYYQTIDLNQIELNRIKELNIATSLAAFYDQNRFEIIGDVTHLVEALNLGELYIRKTIKMCKNISAYKSLKQDDQLSILKVYFIELIVICFSFTFDPKMDGFPIILNENSNKARIIPLSLLYEAKKQNALYFCRQYSNQFHNELEQDSTIRDLVNMNFT